MSGREYYKLLIPVAHNMPGKVNILFFGDRIQM